MFWVAFAGPLSNFFLAVIGSFFLAIFYILHFFSVLPANEALFSMMEMLIYVNMLLAVFNLLPLHPLDGGKVMARFLPVSWNLFLTEHQNYSYIVLIALLVLGGFHYIAKPILLASEALIIFSQWISSFFTNFFM